MGVLKFLHDVYFSQLKSQKDRSNVIAQKLDAVQCVYCVSEPDSMMLSEKLENKID